MELKILEYAKKHINLREVEDVGRAYIESGKLYLELHNSGRCYQLADEEIIYQAEEYLKSELEQIRHE